MIQRFFHEVEKYRVSRYFLTSDFFFTWYKIMYHKDKNWIFKLKTSQILTRKMSVLEVI